MCVAIQRCIGTRALRKNLSIDQRYAGDEDVEGRRERRESTGVRSRAFHPRTLHRVAERENTRRWSAFSVRASPMGGELA